MESRAAVFLDRDGTINENVLNAVSGRWEAPLTVDQVRLIPGAAEGLRALQDAGFALILVSNQPNYALGKASLESMEAVHQRVVAQLEDEDIQLVHAYYCFHHPNGHVAGFGGACICRKPSPHFLKAAQAEYGVDLAASWMVGDRGSDIGCGHAAGVGTIFLTSVGHVRPRSDEPQPDFEAGDLKEAARLILEHTVSGRRLAPSAQATASS